MYVKILTHGLETNDKMLFFPPEVTDFNRKSLFHFMIVPVIVENYIALLNLLVQHSEEFYITASELLKGLVWLGVKPTCPD